MKVIKVFTKQGCANCPQAKKVVEEYGKEHNEVIIKCYDVGECGGLAESAFYNIFSTPTVIVLKDDIEVKRISGIAEKEDLE